jgi:hypothetical protein
VRRLAREPNDRLNDGWCFPIHLPFDSRCDDNHAGTGSAEEAYLDNFAIQVMNDPGLIGYIVVYSGKDSCAGEAEGRAIEMRKYLTERRGVHWNRVMWKDGGRFRGKGLEVFHLGVLIARLATFAVPFEPAAPGQIIRPCRNLRKTKTELQ